MRPVAVRNKIALTLIIAALLLSISLGVYVQVREKNILMVLPLKDYWDEEVTKPKVIFGQNEFMGTIAHRLIKEGLKRGKVLGAISIAPITLVNAKVLIGKKATAWPALGNRLKWVGTTYTGEPVEIDGKIVTADCPDSAEEFAKTILSLILQK